MRVNRNSVYTNHQALITTEINLELLTIIYPKAQVTLPPPLINKGYKRINVCSAISTPNDSITLYNRQMLEAKKIVNIKQKIIENM